MSYGSTRGNFIRFSASPFLLYSASPFHPQPPGPWLQPLGLEARSHAPEPKPGGWGGGTEKQRNGETENYPAWIHRTFAPSGAMPHLL